MQLLSTPKHNDQLAARLAWKLTSGVKKALKGLPDRDFHRTKGLKNRMDILQARIGALTVPDLANSMNSHVD